MPKNSRALRFDLDSLVLDAGAREPLHRQLRDQIRQAILEGRLRPGQRVPSTRGLADSLGVGRNTVASAYDQLTSEGYLVPSVGSGTRVSPRGRARPPRRPAAPAAPRGCRPEAGRSPHSGACGAPMAVGPRRSGRTSPRSTPSRARSGSG